MSRRALTLPLRLSPSSRQQSQQWVCRRCLATQSESKYSVNTSLPPGVDASTYDPSLPAQKRRDPATGQTYPLKESDFLLKKPLPQVIPQQYLQHSTSEILHENEKAQRERTTGHKKMVGVVVSAGKMEKTVKVRIPGQRWEKRIGKYFADHTNHLVHDPNNSLIAGDVVELHRLRVSTVVHHVVARIVTPFGKPIHDRPPVPTADERLAAYKKKRFAKLDRRSLRREAAKGNADAISELKSMGLDPGHGAEAGKGEKANLQPNIGKTRDSGKGAILGEKRQKLPKGVLPGGKHEVGKIDERAEHNKQQATRLNQKAKENMAQARGKALELEGQGVGADPASSTTIPRGRVD